jgi:hypothetical protein
MLEANDNEIMQDVRARQAEVFAEQAKYPTYEAYWAVRGPELAAKGWPTKYADITIDPNKQEFWRI